MPDIITGGPAMRVVTKRKGDPCQGYVASPKDDKTVTLLEEAFKVRITMLRTQQHVHVARSDKFMSYCSHELNWVACAL